jgi:hypothetical protein
MRCCRSIVGARPAERQWQCVILFASGEQPAGTRETQGFTWIWLWIHLGMLVEIRDSRRSNLNQISML